MNYYDNIYNSNKRNQNRIVYLKQDKIKRLKELKIDLISKNNFNKNRFELNK